MKQLKTLIFFAFFFCMVATFATKTISAESARPDGESQYRAFSVDGVPFTVAPEPWDMDGVGTHRAVVFVGETKHAAAVTVLPWRRPDLRPETKKIIVVDAKTGKEMTNVGLLHFDSELASIAFEPETVPGEYYVYYLPCKLRKKWADARYGPPWNDYIAAEYATNIDWQKTVKENATSIPGAKLLRFESRTRMDFFTPVGIIATKAEEEAVKAKHPGNMLVFPEDRAFPARLPYGLSWRWAQRGPSSTFTGYASRNEYYAWQLGLWATTTEVQNVRIAFSDLKNGSSTIPAAEATCFNTGGIDWDGRPVTFRVDVPAGKVQPLWCGIQIPRDAAAGLYRGTVTLTAETGERRTIDLNIQVDDSILEDRGDGDLWRHARLRWLNSTIGIDDKPTAPYVSMQVLGNKIEATDKTVLLAANGLPESIRINGREVLEAPVSFVVETGDGRIIAFNASNFNVKKIDDGRIEWTASGTGDGVKFSLDASMEFDGHAEYRLALSSEAGEVAVKDVRLELPLTAYCSEYFMGAGYGGGYRPEKHAWNWQGHYDSFWIGGVKAGLHVEMRGGSYHGPLINDYKPQPPASWSNHGAGSVRVDGVKRAPATVTIATGEMQLTATPTEFEFAALITPVKSLDTKKHFRQRYHHGDPDQSEDGLADGATVFNLHHARRLNPVINYPWLVRRPLIDHIKTMHEKGVKVKLYYTIRELTTHATEVHALKSLNHEIFAAGVGYGSPWLCEHLIDDYKPAWYTELPGQDYDAALVLNGFSRWINYYLEGYRWMLENYNIDGVYMDDVSFDRPVLKRMKKIMNRYRPDSLIDLHSNTAYSVGPANQYAGFYPYIDRTWFGESFRYNEMSPDQWLVTFSSIPFGEMSEMLQDGGNPYLGMIYGATNRIYRTTNRAMLVELWNLWKSFGIEDSTMIGYWDENAAVETDLPNVKATVFVRPEKTLLVVANFGAEEHAVTLRINWKTLGLNPSNVVVTAPALDGLQEAGTPDRTKPIVIPPKKGCFFILSNK